jgi:hypothetical protein
MMTLTVVTMMIVMTTTTTTTTTATTSLRFFSGSCGFVSKPKKKISSAEN